MQSIIQPWRLLKKKYLIGRFVFGRVVIRFYFYFYPKYQPFIRTMRTDSRVHFCFYYFQKKVFIFLPDKSNCWKIAEQTDTLYIYIYYIPNIRIHGHKDSGDRIRVVVGNGVVRGKQFVPLSWILGYTSPFGQCWHLHPDLTKTADAR